MYKEQELIATSPSVNVWVSANAGAGKTRILTHRVLRMLAEGSPPSSILCLTYTNAGAAEMRERIVQEIGRWATIGHDACAAALEALTGYAPDGAMVSRAQALFAQVVDREDSLKIETIHAFCQSLLRRFPLEANIFPHFQLMDTAETHVLAHACLTHLLTHAQADAALQESLSFLATSRADATVAKLALGVIGEQLKWRRFFRKIESVEAYVAALAAQLQVEVHGTEEDGFVYSPEQLAGMRAVVAKMCDSPEDGARGRIFAEWFAQLENVAPYVAAWLTSDGGVRKKIASKSDLNEREKEALAQERARIEGGLKAKAARDLVRETGYILRFAAGLLAVYEHEKLARGWMDFDDMIAHAEALLGRSAMRAWVLYKLDGAIDHVLIDEAQDTSPAQWRIVGALTEEFFAGEGAAERPRSLFVVGDFKQSIFSFQGADADLFLTMKARVKLRVEQAGKEFYELALEKSYRSGAAVLEAVDAIFADILPDVRHGLHREGAASRVELWPMVVTEKAEKPEGWALPDAQLRDTAEETLVAALVDTVAGWIGVRDLPAKGRKVEAGDVMILLRKRGTLAARLVNAFKARGVPVSGADRMVLTDHLAVQDMLALLQFSLLPQDDYTLACVLKSPFCNVSEEALFALASTRSGSLFETLKMCADFSSPLLATPAASVLVHPEYHGFAKASEGEGKIFLPERSEVRKSGRGVTIEKTHTPHQDFVTLHEECRLTKSILSPKGRGESILSFLQRVLSMADTRAPSAMIAEILTYEMRRHFAARLGEDALVVLDQLMQAAQAFEAMHPPSVQGFLAWMAHTHTEFDRGNAAENVVRVMTVHGAKGLQAPIVMLPDAASQLTRKENLVWHQGTPHLLPPDKGSHGIAEESKAWLKTSMHSEYMRLFYVALTRAEDELYILGYTGKKNAPEHSWYSLAHTALAPISEMVETPVGQGMAVIATQTKTMPAAPETLHPPLRDSHDDVPAWATTPPVPEPMYSAPLLPSKQGAEAEAAAPSPLARAGAATRGRMVHHLLQYLPQVAPEHRVSVATQFMQSRYAEVAETVRREAVAGVVSLLANPDFAHLWSGRREAPVAGRVQGQLVAGQVDLLAMKGDEVWVVDYKTTHLPPQTVSQVPAGYQKQMALYAAVLKQAYPTRRIRTFLLWTEDSTLMELDEVHAETYVIL